MDNLYTLEGLQKLAEILERARGQTSYREFSDALGVSHTTVGRILGYQVKQPKIETLMKIAKYTNYTLEEIIAICQSNDELPSPPKTREYLVAEDALPVVNSLPIAEAARLAQMIIDRIVSDRL